MKKLLKVMLMLCLTVLASTANAEVTFENDTYVATKSKSNVTATITPYFYKDTDGIKYQIILSANGRAYIIKTSKKSGKEYKKYLGEEISRDICKKCNVAYVESKK